MVPRLHKRGSSFKGACGYILHDPGKPTADRVGWSATQNLISPPDGAWFEMFETWRDSDALKEASGRASRGRKNTTPVLHYTLSWPESETPTPEHMRETALSSLKALGLQEHQALMAAHGDKKHMHLHVVVNTVHPETGLTAGLKFSKRDLSKWALDYEKEHGIHCQQRVDNANELARIEALRLGERLLAEFAKGAGYEPKLPERYQPVKDRSPTRPQWFELKEVRDRVTRLGAEMDLYHHKQERGAVCEPACNFDPCLGVIGVQS